MSPHELAETQALRLVIAKEADFDEGQKLLLGEVGNTESGSGHGSRAYQQIAQMSSRIAAIPSGSIIPRS
jgi:hypothetical protein